MIIDVLGLLAKLLLTLVVWLVVTPLPLALVSAVLFAGAAYLTLVSITDLLKRK